jgi:hypothetical protein
MRNVQFDLLGESGGQPLLHPFQKCRRIETFHLTVGFEKILSLQQITSICAEDGYHYSAACGRLVALGFDVSGKLRIYPVSEEPPRLFFHERKFIK